MRELDCDFCGAQAAGAYEVGPEPPDRSPTDRRRLVLCADCRATLTDAIEPLRERLAAAESADGGSVADSASGTPTPTDSADDSTETGGSTTTDSTDSTATADSTDSTDSDDSVESTDSADTSASSSTDPLSGPDGAARNGASPTQSGTGADDGDDTATTGGNDTAPANGDDTATADGDDTDTSDARSSEPPEFRRVMRLLNNRTFPVDRAEFTELATGAYDLDEREVDQIVEYAVERGVLTVESGQLQKG
ncbi:MAG: hypothetical protein ABEI99_10090 [Halobaculum sp.]